MRLILKKSLLNTINFDIKKFIVFLSILYMFFHIFCSNNKVIKNKKLFSMSWKLFPRTAQIKFTILLSELNGLRDDSFHFVVVAHLDEATQREVFSKRMASKTVIR